MFDFLLSSSQIAPWEAAWKVIAAGGWIPLVFFALWIGVKMWVLVRQNKWAATQKFVLLAVDVPQEHLQSPRAMEHFFATLWGIYGSLNYLDKYWRGKFQLSETMEIVSIEGYVQFLIYTPTTFRDTVEAALFAQFPDCEIVEVEDYAQQGPKSFPSETHKLWGTEFRFNKSDFYPIRTYPSFEDNLADQSMTDPMSSLLEVMAKIGPGEQIWIQWIAAPLADDWQKGAKKVIDGLVGRPVAPQKSIVQTLFAPLGALFREVGGIVSAGFGHDEPFLSGATDSGADDTSSVDFNKLTAGERAVIEGIQNKISKPGFEVKMRFVYLAENERFSVPRGVSGIMGAFKQYSDLNMNSVRPESKTLTSTDYLFKERRLNKKRDKILRAYRGRSKARGRKGIILNTEEFASLWHFPADYVRTPQLKRSITKAVEPPAALPTERHLPGIQGGQPIVVAEHALEESVAQPAAEASPTTPTVVLEGAAPPPAESPQQTVAANTVEPSTPPSLSSRPTAPSTAAAPPDNLPIG